MKDEITIGMKDFNIPEGHIPIVAVCISEDSVESADSIDDDLTGKVILSECGHGLAKHKDGEKMLADLLRAAADSFSKQSED